MLVNSKLINLNYIKKLLFFQEVFKFLRFIEIIKWIERSELMSNEVEQSIDGMEWNP